MDFHFQVKLRLVTHNKNVEAVLSMYEDITVRVCNEFISAITPLQLTDEH